MYFATMWSYLSGFAALVYIAAPVIYLTLGVLPVPALSTDFFVRLVPFLLVNQLLFFVVADGRPTWRGQQYSLALFPVWIRSFTSAFGNVFLGRALDFAVTPKEKRRPPGHRLGPGQAPAVGDGGLLVLAAGRRRRPRSPLGQADLWGTVFNIVWVVFDLVDLLGHHPGRPLPRLRARRPARTPPVRLGHPRPRDEGAA